MEKVRIGFIGCGGIARWHFDLLSKVEGAEVVALTDPNDDMIQRAKRDFPHLANARVYCDYEHMLAEGGLDATHINTPHTQHVDQILDSFSAGLHVFTEKPFVTSVEDCHRCIQARETSGKVGGIAYQRHTQPEFIRIKREIDSGQYGEVTMVSALLSQEWKRFTTGTWRQDPALSGGGMMLDSGSHMVDILLWCTGLKAESVNAFIDNRGTPVDIDSAISVKFTNGAMGTITINGDAPNWHEDITIFCERGAFFVRDGKLTIRENDSSKLTCENLPRQTDQDRNFVDTVLGKDTIAAAFESGLRVMELSEAAYKSSEQGGAPVKVGS
ncbi:MAG: Gfo/Idh/MocA family oxidoreductase [Fimbriimonadaceae bacterium]|nr:Gfo/Idh/MocA family oxidoreductase [Fimbriimonadaceae bacterium]